MKAKRVFLFGKFYTVVSENEENLKEARISQKSIDEAYEQATPYEVNKMSYILENFNNEKSMTVAWNRYESYILKDEKIKGKDLHSYSTEEIIDLMASVFTTSHNMKKNVYSFIKQYLTWCKDKGLCQYNFTDLIDENSVVEVNQKALKKEIYSIKEIDEICEEMLDAGIPVYRIIPLILGRYGIVGENCDYMCNLKWSDIDEERMQVNICDHKTGELLTTIPVDSDIFMKWIEKAKEEKEFNNFEIVDNGFVIKRSSKISETDELTTNFSTLYGHLQKAFKEIGIRRITFNQLLKSRMMDLLLQMRESRKLTTKDVLNVIKIFKPEITGGGYTSMCRNYETLTGGDKILKAQGVKPSMLIDQNSKELVKKLRAELFNE